MSDPNAFDELPELMPSLRSIGSRRRSPNESHLLLDEQDRFFAPLIDSRRAASEAISRLQVISAFDARRLTALIDATVRAFAAERFGARAPARRAFEAELFEIVEPLREALLVLGAVVETMSLTQAAPIQDAQWTRWLTQIRVVFHAADSSWPVLRGSLAASPLPVMTTTRWPFGGHEGPR